MTDQKEKFMKIALKQARLAEQKGEIPIGAVVVKDGKVVSRAYNRRITYHDPTAHAEVLALKKAGKRLGVWNLTGCDLYVTLEPCVMCYGACLNARIGNIYFGAYDSKFGIENTAKSGVISFNHTLNIEGGILQEQCSKILTDFFADLRKKKVEGK